MRVFRFDTIDSTSLALRRHLRGAAGELESAAFVAAEQSGGIGRLGRAWHSPRGGLWLTIAIPVDSPPSSTLGLGLGVAACRAVREALRRHGSTDTVMLKWPNDVMVRARKAAGVLTEIVRMAGRFWVLVGVGINANLSVADLPPELQQSAITLRAITEHPIDLDALESDLLNEVESAIRNDHRSAISQARELLWGVGHRVIVTTPDAGRTSGVVCGLADDGALLLQVDGAVQSIRSAEFIDESPDGSR